MDNSLHHELVDLIIFFSLRRKEISQIGIYGFMGKTFSPFLKRKINLCKFNEKYFSALNFHIIGNSIFPKQLLSPLNNFLLSLQRCFIT